MPFTFHAKNDRYFLQLNVTRGSNDTPIIDVIEGGGGEGGRQDEEEVLEGAKGGREERFLARFHDEFFGWNRHAVEVSVECQNPAFVQRVTGKTELL